MKNLSKFILLCFFCITTIAGVAQSSMLPILDEGNAKIEELENNNNTIVHMEYDIVFKDNNKSIYRTLYNTRTYYFYAFASDRISDLDMELYQKIDDEWEKIKTDATASAHSFISFTPEVTGKYGLLIKGYEFVDDYTASHYGLIIYND